MSELYQFTRGGEAWYYTSGPGNVVYSGNTYEPVLIKRNNLNITNDPFKSALSINLPLGNSLGLSILNNLHAESILLRVWKNSELYWIGRVKSIKMLSDKFALECESTYNSINRQGLRGKYERFCRHVLYGYRCGLDANTYKNTGTVSAVDGTDITITGLVADPIIAEYVRPDKYHALGMLEANGDSVMIEKRYFEEGVLTNRFKVVRSINVSVNDAVSIYAGCNHLPGDCYYKFNNFDRFGGFSNIPDKNMFEKGI